MNTDEHRLNALTETIIGCAYRVSNKLGSGYLEKVYRNSMGIELRKAGLRFAQEVPLSVKYDGEIVGEYFADIIVEGVVLIELKSIRALDDAHTAQCINYLTTTGLPICLLLNFGKSRVEVKRLVGRSYPS
jgi:GxxExxY protein